MKIKREKSANKMKKEKTSLSGKHNTDNSEIRKHLWNSSETSTKNNVLTDQSDDHEPWGGVSGIC